MTRCSRTLCSLAFCLAWSSNGHADDPKPPIPFATRVQQEFKELNRQNETIHLSPEAFGQSPSKDQVLWMGRPVSIDVQSEYNYVGPSKTDVRPNVHGNIAEQYSNFRGVIERRFLRALLVQAGLQWQRTSFGTTEPTYIPGQLDILNVYTSLRFRFSRQDMIQVQSRPGYYTDLHDFESKDFHAPVDYAYIHVASRQLQFVAGVSDNPWRKQRWIPGGGIRWQITDRWKLKFIPPEPMLEYKAREDLHVYIGGDLRGDTYRVNKHFGDNLGRPDLNNALVDYQELRVGTGFSWNVRPLIEINMMTGAVVERRFDFFRNNASLRSSPAPFINFNVALLFQPLSDTQADPWQPDTQNGQFQVPIYQSFLNRFFK